MNEWIEKNTWKKYIWVAVIFGLVFVWLEIMPIITYTSTHEYGGKAIEKARAEQLAAAFVKEHIGEEAKDLTVMHQANKLILGYLNKEKLNEDYEKQFDKKIPNDYFQVSFQLEQHQGSGFVNLHMYSGEVTGWNFNFTVKNQDVSELEQKAAIEAQLAKTGLSEIQNIPLKIGRGKEWSGRSEIAAIGEAKLQIRSKVQYVNGEIVVSRLTASFSPPESYQQYVKSQDSLAGYLTGIGYLLMSIILCILAIVYAILYRKFTSFKYGSILTLIFLIAYIIMNINMLDAVIAAQGEGMSGNGMKIFTLIITLLLSLVMAGSVYISIVAGDGLWKAQNRQVWPRMGQPGYGTYVMRSAVLSYLFAFAMLGLQPVIFLLLEKVIGTWSTTDVTMSPYNMSALWLMPVLAWAAAISEEAVFRFFGIGIFRKWFKNTFLAALLPTLFWALGHVTYPFYPATTRLIELMIIGLLFSFIFVRYGFITAMFTHAIFNSAAVGSSLIMVGTTKNIVSAVFFLVLPLIIAYVLKMWDDKKKNSITPYNPIGAGD